MRHLKYCLQWLAVIPGALLGGLLLTFLLHLILYSTLNHFIDPYPKLLEQILSPMVIAAGFIWFGTRIAPARKIETATVLFGLWMILLGGAVVFALFNRNINGHQIILYGNGLAPVMAFVGGIVSFLFTRNKIEKEHKI